MSEQTSMPSSAENPGQPDHFLVGAPSKRMPDGGPVYQETPPDPYADDAPSIAEPFNTGTASIFIIIAVIYGWRVIRTGIDKHRFVACCLPILLAGGIGGTLYHALRTQRVFFLLDVIPIVFLGAIGSIYLLIRIGKRAGLKRILLYALSAISFYLFLNTVIFHLALQNLKSNFPNLAVNLSYASLAVMLVIPLVIVLIRTRFRHGSLVTAALASFVIAWFCRLVDRTGMVDLSMGTHWLWHIFGAITTVLVIEYFYRVEQEEV